MRPENEEQQCLMTQSKSDHDTTAYHKKSKISYTQSSLLSLSELDTCKRLPSGLDKSVLGELNDSWNGLLQPCPNSDSGRYQGNISRHASQNIKLGVLGPGAFPRIPNSASAPVAQGTGCHILKRSSTAYRPPHLSKNMRNRFGKLYQSLLLLPAIHQSRRDQDSYNDETFGSFDHLSQEREDEERRRRESFELMRKEQEKAFKKKENKISDEHKENLQPDIATTLEASENAKGLVKTYSESEKPVAVDSAGHYFTTQSEILFPQARKRSHEKNLGRKSLICTSISEPFEQSLISELSEHYPTQHQSVKGWRSTFERNGRVPNFANEYGTSEDLTLIQKGQETDPTASSKLKLSFSDKISACETGDNGFGKNLQTTEFTGMQREFRRFPFLTSDNNFVIPSTVTESGSVKMYREGIKSSGWDKKTVVSKIEESLSVSDDIWTKTGLESNLSPVSAFNGTADVMDEIHLPEEDSLITVDDCILPQSDVVASRRLVKADFLTSTPQVNIVDKLAALDLSFNNKRSPQRGLESLIFDSYNMIGMDTSYQNLHFPQQFYPQFSSYQTDPERTFYNSSNAQAHMNSDMRFLDQETYHFNPQTFHSIPTNMFADPFQHPHAELKMFDHHINAPQLHQMHIPSKFSSPQQVRGLPRVSYHPIDEMTYYAPEQHPAQNFPLHYQQQYYGGLEMPISDQTAAGNNYQAACNRLFKMEVRAKQMHSLTMAGRGSRNYGRQDDIGFWYGH